MDLVSYRGPGVSGGVSSGLGNFWKNQQNGVSNWWFMDKNALNSLSSQEKHAAPITVLPETVVAGHYRYCNEFLWPILHDLPQYAKFRDEDRRSYQRFNWMIADYIDFETQASKEYFVQDYQLALLPQLLAPFSRKTVAFWHIPWPKNVPEEYLEPMCEVARGLLNGDALGFHINEYAENFMSFAENYLPEYRVNRHRLTIEKRYADVETFNDSALSIGGAPSRSSYILRPLPNNKRPRSASRTKLLVRPLGIDLHHWSALARQSHIHIDHPALAPLLDRTFILSVDRADYTKSVFERMLIVDRFFEENPEQIGSFSFVQICGKTRPGLQPFDDYWHTCKALAAATNHRWSQNGWQPVVWIEESFTPQELAHIYQRSRAMLVNPVRDGLNLTAMEYAACQNGEPGVLLLSPGAGAWDKLGSHALPVNPLEPAIAVKSIKQSLSMPEIERQERVAAMKKELENNTLAQWWNMFAQFRPVERVAQTGKVRALRRRAG